MLAIRRRRLPAWQRALQCGRQPRASEDASQTDEVIRKNRDRRDPREPRNAPGREQDQCDFDRQGEEHERVKVDRILQVRRVERSRLSIEHPGEHTEDRHQCKHGPWKIVDDRAARASRRFVISSAPSE